MERSVTATGTLKGEVRKAGRRSAAAGSGVLFGQQLAGLREDGNFNRAVAPFLKNANALTGKNPMKFGIMQSTLKDYDPGGKVAATVAGLDEKKAKQIYRMIWERAGCSRLAPELAAEHFAAYVRRPRSAVEALRQSSGDPAAYAAALRKGRPVSAAQLRPELPSVPDLQLPAAETQRSAAPDAVAPTALQPEVVRTGGATDETERGRKESAGAAAIFKAVGAAGMFHNAQPPVMAPELKIAESGIAIAFEKRDRHPGLDAYRKAQSGKMLADGMVVKLKIPF